MGYAEIRTVSSPFFYVPFFLFSYFVENSKSRHNDSTQIQGYNHPPYNFPGEEKSLTSQRKNVHSPGSHEPDVHRPGNYELYNNNPGSCRPDRHRSNGHQDMIDSSREIRRADKHIMIIPNKMPEFSVLRNSGNDFSPLSASQATAGVEQRLKSLDQKSRIVNMVIEDKERLSQRYATHNGTNDRDFLHSMASKSRSTYTVPQHKDYPTGEMKSHKFVGNSKAFDIPSMSHMSVRSCLPADGRQQTFKDGNVASALYALGKHNDAAAFISLPLAERGTDDAINGKRRPYSATSDSCVGDDKPSNGGRKRFFSYPGDILSMNDTRKQRKMDNETRDMASKRYENIKGSFNDLRSTGHRSFDLQKQSSPNKSFLSKEEICFDQELRGFSPAEEKLLNSRPNHAMAFSTTYTPYLKALETTVIQTAPKANNQHGSDISSPSSAIHRKESSSVPTAGLRMREIFFHKPGRSASCSDIFKPQCGKSYCSLNKDPSSGASSENTDWQHSRKQTRAQESNVNGCAGQNIGGSNVSKDLHQKSGSRFVRNFHDSHPSVNVEYAMKPIVGPPFYLKTTHQNTNWH